MPRPEPNEKITQTAESTPPVSGQALSVATILRERVVLEIESLDRMYLNVYVPKLQHETGAVWFFRGHRGQTFASSALMAPISEGFVKAIDQFAQTHHTPVVIFKRGERKDDIAATQRAQRAQRTKCTGAEGVVFIGEAQEKAQVYRTQKRRHAHTGLSYPWMVRSTALVNYYYFYCQDDDFGPFFIKFCSYFPYTAKLCINGNEYLKRQLEKEGIVYHTLDNGLLACADPARAQAIADGLSADKIKALLRKWLARLPQPFTAEDQAAGYT